MSEAESLHTASHAGDGTRRGSLSLLRIALVAVLLAAALCVAFAAIAWARLESWLPQSGFFLNTAPDEYLLAWMLVYAVGWLPVFALCACRISRATSAMLFGLAYGTIAGAFTVVFHCWWDTEFFSRWSNKLAASFPRTIEIVSDGEMHRFEVGSAVGPYVNALRVPAFNPPAEEVMAGAAVYALLAALLAWLVWLLVHLLLRSRARQLDGAV